MLNVLTPTRPAAHHSIATPVDRRAHLTDEVRRLLLSFSPSDKRTRQLHKDLQQRKNKAADTLGSMFDAALTKQETSKLRAFGNLIAAFCARDNGRICRSFQQLFPLETREDGELNNVQVLIAQGDRSPQTLDRFIGELDDSIAVHTEMKEWALQERFIARRGAQ
ncbi:MAG TPA: hypothetical protein VNO75_12300 [Gemmatimonadaceae bacterium]|nr:hypothetical protein [Gemmatimonadaceae bacterium]